jgi:hypothetical protein
MRSVFPVSPHTVVYPDQFKGTGPRTPGRYDVAWRRVFGPREGVDALVTALAQASQRPIATDEFMIPERVAA